MKKTARWLMATSNERKVAQAARLAFRMAFGRPYRGFTSFRQFLKDMDTELDKAEPDSLDATIMLCSRWVGVITDQVYILIQPTEKGVYLMHGTVEVPFKAEEDNEYQLLEWELNLSKRGIKLGE